jgi:hypothetical protein
MSAPDISVYFDTTTFVPSCTQLDETDVHHHILDSTPQLLRNHFRDPTAEPSTPSQPQLRHHEQEPKRLQAATGPALYPAHDRFHAQRLLRSSCF